MVGFFPLEDLIRLDQEGEVKLPHFLFDSSYVFYRAIPGMISLVRFTSEMMRLTLVTRNRSCPTRWYVLAAIPTARCH